MNDFSSDILLRVNDVSIGYRHYQMPNVSFEVKTNDFIGVLGPNGGGKTTLLKSIASIIPLQKGRWEGPNNIEVGYVPQQTTLDTLFPFSAEEVIRQGILGRTKKKWRFRKTNQRIAHLAQQFDLIPFLPVPYRLLSGGQKQRTLIARALMVPPKLLLLDEPINGLDNVSSQRLIKALVDGQKAQTHAVIMVTHQPKEIQHLATHYIHVDIMNRNFSIRKSHTTSIPQEERDNP